MKKPTGKNIKKKYILVILAAVLMSVGCGEKIDHMKEAQTALTDGKYDKAVEQFGFFIAEQEGRRVQGSADERRKNMNLSEAYRGIGIAKFEQERYDEAEEAFEAVIDRGGVSTPILYRFLGLSLMEQKKYEEALDYFTKGANLCAEDILMSADKVRLDKEAFGLNDGDPMEKYAEVIREMRKLRIACYEKLYEWKSASKAAEEYINEYPDDEAVQKEAAFLRTR